MVGRIYLVDGGKDATSYKADAFTPYAFILEEGGKLIVHPSLAGESLKEKAPLVIADIPA